MCRHTQKGDIEMMKTIVVVGAGKGLGNHVARLFGQKGFRVILMARNENALEEYREDFFADCIETYTYPVDAADPETLTEAFDRIKQEFGIPDVLFYNVGITELDEPGKMDSKRLMQRYQIDVASAYHCVQQVVSDEFARKNGAILITGGGLALYPMAEYTPLSMDKAALRTMTSILHQQLEPKGIFVGTLLIKGAISIDPKYNPQILAGIYWKMYTERREYEIIY